MPMLRQPADGCFQEGTQSKLDPKGKRHSSHRHIHHRHTQSSNSNEPRDDIQLPIRTANLITTHTLMSVQLQDSLSNKLDQLRKSTAQGNQLTRLSCYINTESQCDKKSLPTDLHKHWNHRETLSIESITTVMMTTIRIILMSEHSSDSISNRLA